MVTKTELDEEYILDIREYPLTYCNCCKEEQPVTLFTVGDYKIVVCDECNVAGAKFRKNI